MCERLLVLVEGEVIIPFQNVDTSSFVNVLWYGPYKIFFVDAESINESSLPITAIVFSPWSNTVDGIDTLSIERSLTITDAVKPIASITERNGISIPMTIFAPIFREVSSE